MTIRQINSLEYCIVSYCIIRRLVFCLCSARQWIEYWAESHTTMTLGRQAIS